MILLAQPRGRRSIGPGQTTLHVGDFLGDLTKFEKQGRRTLPRAHDGATRGLTAIDEIFETVPQLGGKGAQLRQLDCRQGERLPGERSCRPLLLPLVTSGASVYGAGADSISLGNGANRAALVVVGLDGRPVDMALGPVVAL